MTNTNHPPIGTALRHKDTGDLAFVAEKDGVVCIKPDLPLSPVTYPITALHRYHIEARAKRLPPGSWARVAYEADKALCDIHPELKRQPDWASLHPLKKAKFIDGRYDFGHPLRVELYNAIIKLLESKSD